MLGQSGTPVFGFFRSTHDPEVVELVTEEHLPHVFGHCWVITS